MAEGGCLPWKRQSINTSRGPVGNYRDVLVPLPNPPKGQKWDHDVHTNEWKLVSTQKEEISKPVKQAVNDRETIEKDSPKEKKSSWVEGVDYVEHTVLPSDTFQGLCLSYGIRPHKLRQANGFSGSNLLLAPSKLVIPLNHVTDPTSIRLQNKDSPDYKIHSFLSELPQFRNFEAKAYLEIADWNVEEAIEEARQDLQWEQTSGMTAEQIRIKDKKVEAFEIEPTNHVTLDVHTAIPVVENPVTKKTGPLSSTGKLNRELKSNPMESQAYRQSNEKVEDLNDMIASGEVELKPLLTPLLQK